MTYIPESSDFASYLEDLLMDVLYLGYWFRVIPRLNLYPIYIV